MKQLAFFVTLVFLNVSAQVSNAAAVQWSGNGHWYEAVLVESGISWTDARDAAAARDGYLASITSAAENNFVFSLIDYDAYWNTEYDHGRGPWLGGTDEGTESMWRWINGDPWTYANWARSEPNNAVPGGENYLHYFAYFAPRGLVWNDNDNYGNPNQGLAIKGYIIEFNAEPIATRDLIAHYELDGNGLESTGNNPDGMLKHGVTGVTDRLGNPNGALLFDGVDDYVDIAGFSGVANAFSVTAWFRRDGSSAPIANLVNIRKSTTDDSNEIRLRVPDPSRVGLPGGGEVPVIEGVVIDQSGSPSGRYKDYFGASQLAVSMWHHGALTWDGTELHLYVDGVEDQPYGKLVDGAPVLTDTVRLAAIGSCIQGASANCFFHGAIDDVRVYNGALSASEIALLALADADEDGVLDVSDNCPVNANPDQADNDVDGQGDVCDSDDDNDNVQDTGDNCQFTSNPSQSDIDLDETGDACDDDADGDSVPNVADNCPTAPNLDQSNTDGDAEGDACDSDDDNDGVSDDPAPGEPLDNCPLTSNPGQADLDGDNIGDACDIDVDGDGAENGIDNCPMDVNPGQDDTDYDGQGDVCDNDDDNDGVLDSTDNCQLIPNFLQSDLDGDGEGDACDGDRDGDGVANEVDNCETVPNSAQNDFDSDGEGDACDADVDGDGVPNSGDQCPLTQPGEVLDPDTGCVFDPHFAPVGMATRLLADLEPPR